MNFPALASPIRIPQMQNEGKKLVTVLMHVNSKISHLDLPSHTAIQMLFWIQQERNLQDQIIKKWLEKKMG